MVSGRIPIEPPVGYLPMASVKAVDTYISVYSKIYISKGINIPNHLVLPYQLTKQVLMKIQVGLQ